MEMQPALRAQSPRWREGVPINVWISEQNAPNHADALVERAMKTWSDVRRPNRLRLVRTSEREHAPLRVNFVAGDHVFTARRGRSSIGSRAQSSGADVHIGRDLASTGDRLEQQIILYLTALHELGHALGLRHTDDFSTIMYSFRRPDDGERYSGRTGSACAAQTTSAPRARPGWRRPTSRRCGRSTGDERRGRRARRDFWAFYPVAALSIVTLCPLAPAGAIDLL